MVNCACIESRFFLHRYHAGARAYVLAMLGLFGWVPSVHADTPTAQPAPAQSSSLFDFWLGDWRVSWVNADGSQGQGRNRISRVLGSAVIEENFEEALGSKEPRLLGKSLTVLEKSNGVWRQSWADNQGGFFAFRGSVDGDKRIFMTDWRGEGDKRSAQRMVFYAITPQAFDWDWESSQDAGKSWKLQWRIHYERFDK